MSRGPQGVMWGGGQGHSSTLWRPVVIEIRRRVWVSWGSSGTGGSRRHDNQFEAESET